MNIQYSWLIARIEMEHTDMNFIKLFIFFFFFFLALGCNKEE